MTDSIGEALRRIDQLATKEKAVVEALCDAFGYGRVMQLCEHIWAEKHPGANRTVGPSAVFLVPCQHEIKDEHGHCDLCCGVGRVTKAVAQLASKSMRR